MNEEPSAYELATLAARQKRAAAAQLTESKILAFKRLSQHGDFQTVWDTLTANFPVDESVFQIGQAGVLDPYAAAVRDGQRAPLLFIRDTISMPSPASTEEATLD